MASRWPSARSAASIGSTSPKTDIVPHRCGSVRAWLSESGIPTSSAARGRRVARTAWYSRCGVSCSRSRSNWWYVSITRGVLSPTSGLRIAAKPEFQSTSVPKQSNVTQRIDFRSPLAADGIAAKLYVRSFNHLVRSQQQRRRDRKAQGFRGLEVDDGLELRRLFDRKIAGLGASAGPALRRYSHHRPRDVLVTSFVVLMSRPPSGIDIAPGTTRSTCPASCAPRPTQGSRACAAPT